MPAIRLLVLSLTLIPLVLRSATADPRRSLLWMSGGGGGGDGGSGNGGVTFPGKLLLGALYPMHYANLTGFGQGGRCGRLNLLEGVQAMEATLFTLERLRESGLLGDTPLGLLAVDTCQDVDVALAQSLNFTNALVAGAVRRGLLRCSDGGVPTLAGGGDEQVVIGLLGAAESDVSVAIASFMKHFRVPQISYLSTTPILSSKEKFPYFLRTVPSDTNTVRGIVDLLRLQNWTYVHVVYDDSSYGTMAFNVFEQVISGIGGGPSPAEGKICISTKIKIDSADWKASDYRRAVHENLLAPSNANVVLVLLSQSPLEAFFEALVSYQREVAAGDHSVGALASSAGAAETAPNGDDESTAAAASSAAGTVAGDAERRRLAERLPRLAWIGTDTWSMRQFQGPVRDFLARSIVLLPRTARIPGFAEHMTRLRPSTRPQNPWLQEWFQDECDCSYAAGAPRSCVQMEEECGRKVFAGFSELPSLHFVSDAVHAYAYAVKSIQEAAAAGHRPMTPQLFTGDLLMSHLRNVTFTKFTGKPFKFHNGVDGPPEYSIQYYNLTSERWITDGTYIGTRNYSKRLTIGKHLAGVIAAFPESRCANDCGNDEAKQFPTSSCCWICIKCGRYDIVVQAEPSQPRYWQGAGHQACQTCANGSRPDAGRRRCQQLPLTWSGYSHPHTVPVAAISAMGLLTTCAFALVFFCKQDTPLIKASGRETSAVLLLGIFLSYLLPYLMMLKPHLLVCALTRVAPGLCFTVCYAAILAKTNRIARIFQVSASSKKTKFTSPISQLYIIGSMVVAELLILAVGLVVDTPGAVVRESNESRRLECSGVRAAHLSTSISFPIVLLLLATLYAFKIRKVPDGFNETRMLAFVNYANCTVVIILIPVMFVLDTEVQTGVVICYGMQLSATAVLLGIFLPRIYIVLVRPEKNTKEAIMCRARSQGLINAKYSQVDMPNSISSIPQDAGSSSQDPTLETVRCLDEDGCFFWHSGGGSGNAGGGSFDCGRPLSHADGRASRAGACSASASARRRHHPALLRENSDPGGQRIPTGGVACACRVHKNVSFSDVDTLPTMSTTQLRQDSTSATTTRLEAASPLAAVSKTATLVRKNDDGDDSGGGGGREPTWEDSCWRPSRREPLPRPPLLDCAQFTTTV